MSLLLYFTHAEDKVEQTKIAT